MFRLTLVFAAIVSLADYAMPPIEQVLRDPGI